MAWIKLVDEASASGLLARIYEAAIKRAGKVFQILKVQSNNPRTLKASMDIYAAAMFGDSPLSRAQREMLATVVSRANDCHYWTQAHAADLRAEVEKDDTCLRNDAGDADAWVAHIAEDYTKASLGAVDRALCDVAIKLTNTPGAMTESDVEALRAAGVNDVGINDAVQVIAYFNYINRIADGLGVDLEPGMPEPNA